MNLSNQQRISNPQLLEIAYAGQSHSQVDNNGVRYAYPIGASTGVGKGVMAAGIILDNWMQGRGKAVWLSENSGLRTSALRDLNHVGFSDDALLEMPPAREAITYHDGVLFTTYATLRSSGESGRRIDQILAWLGDGFDGVIILDEAHKAGGMGKGGKQASDTAMIVVELQERLPLARFVYLSATLAQEPHNLAFAVRLGLWGEGAAFANSGEFVAALEAGGLPLMEEVARYLRARFGYAAPMLSMAGVTFETLCHEITPAQKELWDTLARAWQTILNRVDAALDITGGAAGRAKAYAYQRFWSAHQRFFNTLLTAMMMPSVLRRMQEALDHGNAVVVQIVGTGEATQERRLALAATSDVDLDDVDLTPRDVLMLFLERAFPVQEHEEVSNGNGGTRIVPMVRNGQPVLNRDAVALRDKLLRQVAELEVPENPLDQILAHFGADNVAEITARKRRFERDDNGRRQERRLKKSSRSLEIKAFQDGEKFVLVFSPAGTVGESYHASLAFKNQWHRVHFMLEAGWRATQAVQGLGRSHRTNQASAPHYVLCTTDIRAQARFLSSVARRLNSLGALTRGQRDAATVGGDDGTLISADFDLETKYAEAAVRALIQDIYDGMLDNFSIEDVVKKMGLRVLTEDGKLTEERVPVTRFLNRLLSLEVADMDAVFAEFEARLRANIEYAKENGLYDNGTALLRADKITVLEALDVPGNDGTRYLRLEVERAVRPRYYDDLPFTAKSFGLARRKADGVLVGWHLSRTATDTRTGQVLKTVKVYVPDGDFILGHIDFSSFYDIIALEDSLPQGRDDFRAEWNSTAANCPAVSKKIRHFVSGALLPVWRCFQAEDRVAVYRVRLPDGQVIAREIGGKFLPSVLRELGLDGDVVRISPAEILEKARDGKTVLLSGGLKLKMSRVAGEQRLELCGLSHSGRSLWETAGVIFSEVHNFNLRCFIPLPEAAKAVGRLVESNRVIGEEGQ